jgi:DNA-directed RNA polymerase subunit RPC12/RpoP
MMSQCRDCNNKLSIDWGKANPQKLLAKNRRRWYGITQEEWDALFEKQGRVCAICKSTTSKTKFAWHTDHDHVTNKVRGILCQPCNNKIGFVERYRSIIESYLAQ